VSSTRTGPGELARRVDAAITAAGPQRRLRRGSLRFLRTVALPVGIQGPTAGVIIGPAIIAGIVGQPGALAQVLALAAMGFVAYAFIRFSRSFNTAGSVYGYCAAAAGPGYGLVTAWLLLLVYTSFAAGVYAATADIAQTLLASAGLHIGWLWLALAGAALAIALAYLSIGFSSLVILACEGAAIALITSVAIAVLAAGGYRHHGLTAAPFGAHGVPLTVLALGREAGGSWAGRLARTSRRHGSPAAALTVVGAASVAALLASGAEHTATRAATLIIQYGAYLILAAYLMTVAAALAWTWRTGRRPVPLAVLAAGAAILGYVIYRTFSPLPPAPFGAIALAAAASVVPAVAVLAIPGTLARLRRSPLLAATAEAPGIDPAAHGAADG